MQEQDYDAMREAEMERRERRAISFGRCKCFAPGEAPGTCPGQASCPMCEEDDDAIRAAMKGAGS